MKENILNDEDKNIKVNIVEDDIGKNYIGKIGEKICSAGRGEKLENLVG
jgi:hypothetical protein